MRQYWMRIAGAWILLSLAGKVMKSAEQVLQAAQEARADEIVTAAVEELNDNHVVDPVTSYVDARYDG